jgi:endonuclease/exonuclease/phosphatase family metal-dependent hydrolase
MPPFPKPTFDFDYDLKAELKRLRQHKRTRQIPARQRDRLLVATWNIANLGAQQRRDQDRALIAEIISWFDIVAIQECRENYGDLADLEMKLPKAYRLVMSCVSGNGERMAFVYDSRKLALAEEIGGVAIPPARLKSIKLPGSEQPFAGFDRTPFLCAFTVGKTSFGFLNVHLFFGNNKPASIARRVLETYAVAKWCQARKKSSFTFTRELVALGDFNMPKRAPGDSVFDALTRFGLELPEHSTQIASTIASDAKYDQIAFFPETTHRCFTGLKGVFDFDTVSFPDLWQAGQNKKNFRAYVRYYLSDHRPMWVQMSFD